MSNQNDLIVRLSIDKAGNMRPLGIDISYARQAMSHVRYSITLTGTQQLGCLPTMSQLQQLASRINQFSTGTTSVTNATITDTTGQHQLGLYMGASLPTTLEIQGTSTTAITSSTPRQGGNTMASGSGQLLLMSPAVYGHTLSSGNFPTLDTSAMVSIGQSLPSLPRRLVEQIKAGEFIDFSELPPAKGTVAPTRHSQIVLVQLQDLDRQRKLIPDFITWSQCFAIYTAVLGSDQPNRLPELMAYQLVIAKCAKKYRWPSWVVYDINFRQEAASKPGMSWATVEPSIYTQCFTGMAKDPTDVWCRTCQSLDHSTTSCPLTPSHGTTDRERLSSDSRKEAVPDRRRETICKNFNTKGCSYPYCVRRHVCMNCHRGGHPASACRETSRLRPGGTSSTSGTPRSWGTST